MQIETVAEGIEADEQAETLRSLGCEYGQGYFFARPLEPSAWVGLLHSEATIGVEARLVPTGPTAST
jgi:EAL domain-containing protein (putative c-di-GMP-specific phosphodiesterase class I)